MDRAKREAQKLIDAAKRKSSEFLLELEKLKKIQKEQGEEAALLVAKQMFGAEAFLSRLFGGEPISTKEVMKRLFLSRLFGGEQ